MTNKRMVNIDLLRCISMFLIVLGHYLINTSMIKNFSMNSESYFLYHLITCIDEIGVNVFILISGYFLVDSSFKIKRLVNIWIQVIFYSLIIYLISVVVSAQSFSVTELFKSSTPIFNRSYWFATEYIRLYLIFPFLNILLKNLSKKQHLYLIILIVAMNSVFPTLMNMDNRLKFLGYWSLWFITLYIIIAYIKWYNVEIATSKLVLIWASCTIIMFLSKVSIENITIRFLGHSTGSDLLNHNNSIFMLGSSLAVFLLFKKIQVKSISAEKIIMIISPLTFGIYLFHENPYVKSIIYQFIDKVWNMIGINSKGSLWLLVGLISAVFVFISGCLVDFIRKIIFGYLIDRNKTHHKIINRFQEKIDDVL